MFSAPSLKGREPRICQGPPSKQPAQPRKHGHRPRLLWLVGRQQNGYGNQNMCRVEGESVTRTHRPNVGVITSHQKPMALFTRSRAPKPRKSQMVPQNRTQLLGVTLNQNRTFAERPLSAAKAGRQFRLRLKIGSTCQVPPAATM